MIVDTHTHVFPEHAAARVLAGLIKSGSSQLPGIVPSGDGTLADLLRQMAAAGIDRAATCPIATKPSQQTYLVKALEDLTSGALGEAAREHIIPVGSVHPADPELAKHLAEQQAAGAKAIKVHSYFQEADLDSPEMMNVLKACCDAGLPVIAHTGHDLSFGMTDRASPAMIRRVMAALPELQLVCAHCAGLNNPEALELLLGQEIYVDVSFQKVAGHQALVERFVREHPAEYILFASDWPWSSPAEDLAWIRGLGLDAMRESALLGGNAQRLLKL